MNCITVDGWKRHTMHSQDTQHLIFQIGIYNCVYKTLFANPVTYTYSPIMLALCLMLMVTYIIIML